MENDNFRAIRNERQSAIKVKAMLLKDVLIFSKWNGSHSTAC